jgi:hypothetical protein
VFALVLGALDLDLDRLDLGAQWQPSSMIAAR